MNLRALLLGAALGAILIIPAAASAATKPVFVGSPPSAGKAFRQFAGDANDFFPHGITIHAGDSVAFLPVGFHTVDFPPKGGTPVSFALPGDPVSGVNDAAGQPFWFNGQPALMANGSLFAKNAYGKSLSYNGKKRVESGLGLRPKLKPMTVKFPRTGSYTYYCDVHPGMKGVVHVVGKTAKAPTKKADARVVKNEVASDITAMKRLSNYKPGSGTVSVGASAPHGVELYGFFPAAPTVKVGTTVTFSMPAGSTEDHTASTGPGDPAKDESSYLGVLGASFQSPVIDPRATYPSDPPGGTPATLTSALHGNAFWNSGLIDASKATPLPPSNKVTFGEPGTYDFYCLIHTNMKATVTVTS